MSRQLESMLLRTLICGVLTLLVLGSASAQSGGEEDGIRLIPLATETLPNQTTSNQAASPAPKKPQQDSDEQAKTIVQRLSEMLTAHGQTTSSSKSPLPSQPTVARQNAAGTLPMTGGFKSLPSPGLSGATANDAASAAVKNDLEIRLNPIGTPRHMRGKPSAASAKIPFKPTSQLARKILQAADGKGRSQTERDKNTARAFLKTYRHYLRLTAPDTELNLYRTHTDPLGRRHLRFSQRHQQLRVWPSELIVNLDPEGNVDSMHGSHVPTPQGINTKPVVGADAALVIARNNIPNGERARIKAQELIIYGSGNIPAQLAWKFELITAIDADWIVVVDAVDGKLLSVYNTVQDASVTGSGTDLFGLTKVFNVWQDQGLYYLVDTAKPMFDSSSIPPNPSKTRGAILVFDGKNQAFDGDTIPPVVQVISNNPNSGWLADAVSAEDNFSKTYDYYLNRHKRNSIDNKGGSISATVRLGQNYPNAFWATDLNGMFFGDAKPFAGALDIVAHELTHGVTAYTANLDYVDQSGALNEALSDIFGEMVESYVQGAPDWLVGEKLGKPPRNMKDPSSIAILPGLVYPSKMSQYIAGTDLDNFNNRDNGGVHINSSIINHAYYLLAQGLDGAIGMADAERIFYRALTVHLTRRAQFLDARLTSIQAAEELFGVGSAQALKTAQAFDGVEISDAQATPKPKLIPAGQSPDSTLFVYFDSNVGANRLGRRETTLGDPIQGVALSSPHSGAARKRPSVTGDGSIAIFVNGANDLCLIETNKNTGERCLGIFGVHSVAISRDANELAYILLNTQGTPENVIHVGNLKTGQKQVFPLRSPATEFVKVSSILYADAMNFTLNNRQLIYDALNVLTLQDGSRVGAWSIYAIDLATGTISIVVPPIQGMDIGFPSTGATSANLITFEVNIQSSGNTLVFAGNLNTGDPVKLAEFNGGPAIAGYNGDDTAIVYARPNAALTDYDLIKQPLAADHISPSGNSNVWLQSALAGVIYRRQTLYEIGVDKAGGGSGTVKGSLEGIDCGSTCSADYPTGTQLTLTATADAGSVFAGWNGPCRGTGECSITLNQDSKVTANFTLTAQKTQRLTLSVNKSVSGSGTVQSNIGGIHCGTLCSADYPTGTQVTLTATPNAGSVFVGWGGACAGSAACIVTMNQSNQVTANFAPAFRLTAGKTGAGSGTISDNAALNCRSVCTADYQAGIQLRLTATADTGSVFTGWSGDCLGLRVCVVKMNQARKVRANFNKLPSYLLRVGKQGNGTVTSSPPGIDCGTSCSAKFFKDTQVSLNAIPSPGSSFAGWNGACKGAQACVLKMNQARSVKAKFTP